PFQPQVLHVGTNTGVWTMEQVADADGDGVPDAMENFAPSSGDGDGDGVPDALQAHVGSMVPNLHGPMGTGAGGCAPSRVAAVGRASLARGGDDDRDPRVLVRVEVMDRVAAERELIFHGADFLRPGWSLRTYGPSAPGDEATVGSHALSARAEAVAPDRWRLLL